MIIDAYTATVTNIDDPEAHNSITIEINTFKEEPTVIDMTEALAASIAKQITSTLQNRADKRSDAIEQIQYDKEQKRKHDGWLRIQERKEMGA